MTRRKIIIVWKPIAQTLYIKHRLFIMNKATSVQSFTYLGLVVSEKNVPKNWLIYHYGDMAYNLPLTEKYQYTIRDESTTDGRELEKVWFQDWGLANCISYSSALREVSLEKADLQLIIIRVINNVLLHLSNAQHYHRTCTGPWEHSSHCTGCPS